MFYISICFIRFIFLILIRLIFFYCRLIFIFFDLVYFIEWELVSVNSSIVVMTFLFDWISFLFISFVLLISSLVIFYRKDYILGDENINRFILLVLLFVFSIIMLIIRPNLIRILLGWDGLGLVSYCLVIYYQNIKSFNAGFLTALSNRIGDVCILVAIAWILNFGSWNYIFYLDCIKIDLHIKIIGLLIILAAITKRAQIPFSSWLPAAIAAPTPVSALVHSSTLVTAGVYLLIRFNILFINTIFRKILLLIAGLTIFIAGVAANFEFDLKKIIALSTLRQLGLMIIILAIGFPQLAFFHLLTHALFKALLFICAGSVIHRIKNSQDIRDIGRLVYEIPFSVSCLNIANLALCGIPFLAGFYSKDLILEVVRLSFLNLLIFFLYFFSTGLTVAYSFRLGYYCFSINLNSRSLNNIRDQRKIILKSIVSLLILVIIGGRILIWLIFPYSFIICLPISLKFLTLLVCILGGFLGYLISRISLFFNNKSINFYLISFFRIRIWFLPSLRTTGIVSFPLKIGNKTLKIDFGWLEYFGGQNIYKIIVFFSSFNQFLQNNNLKIFIMLFLFWFIFLLSWIIYF